MMFKRGATGRGIGLASWLGGGSVIVVTAAVAAMAMGCAVLLERLVEQQALARAQLAVTSARELLRRVGEDILTDAQVLAERPTLQRLLREEPLDRVTPFITRYCESSGNTACAVMGPNQQLFATATPAPWEAAATARREQGERFLLATRDGQAVWWGSIVDMADLPGWQVAALRQANAPVIDDLGRQVNAALTLHNYATYQAPPDDPLTALHTAALGGSNASATHLEASDEYAASIPVATANGELVALLDARIPGREFAAITAGFNRLLLVIAVVVALIAGVGGLLYGRWLARPVVQLRDVAQRIGRGELSASVPPVAPLEVGALAESMDEMRHNLLSLTESLRRREAEAQALLNGIVEGVYAVDLQRVIRYINPQIARMLDLPEPHIIGRFCGDVLQPEPVNGVRPCEQHCPILAARASGQASAPETLCFSPSARRQTIIVSAAPVGGMQVQILRDETELEAARRARDSVLGNISHEFRTPLSAQLASIELLRDGLPTLSQDQQAELLGNVQRGVLRLMRLVDNLLESVRIEAGQLAIRQQQVDLAEVVQEAGELLQPLLAQRQLRLEITLPEEQRITVSGDSLRLLQVFINLFSNAIKFAPEQTAIRVGAQVQEGRVEVWVEDEGAGIAGGSSVNIFERFRRSDATEPDAPGLGLGLWIVKSIVDRHHGQVEVMRTANERTRFVVRLPLEIAA
ncbi:MAG: ATP-binding protein [Steroidobacteraceae bacterium]